MSDKKYIDAVLSMYELDNILKRKNDSHLWELCKQNEKHLDENNNTRNRWLFDTEEKALELAELFDKAGQAS
ncbi:MAG: hypothetical protein ACJZ8R_02735 [Pseudohongiellaceae bacterium]|uniref:Uncharacterized protein n=1 Tax=OM182 bacterium MED-G28 TaxID=1986256 RepID=A0A2A5W797_9GAMM|nr:MAG: hypothetical protein CNF02_12575 [OM182 bacterium MED-G28]|tara:strand:- start:38 stop:253 length:216 start_codon:yes stop_codon:yes gene_type:complete